MRDIEVLSVAASSISDYDRLKQPQMKKDDDTDLEDDLSHCETRSPDHLSAL
jgi:hypothetical protein